MELYQLRGLAVVAEVGNLTRAAERLHISQPALSAQIKALEDELGVALFKKAGRGLRPTADGRLLLERCTELFGAVRDLRDGILDPSGPDGDAVNTG